MLRIFTRRRGRHVALMTAMDRVAADQHRQDAEREARLSAAREWQAVLDAVQPDPDVVAQVTARGAVMAEVLTADVDDLLAEVDLLTLPIVTGTLRTEVA